MKTQAIIFGKSLPKMYNINMCSKSDGIQNICNALSMKKMELQIFMVSTNTKANFIRKMKYKNYFPH